VDTLKNILLMLLLAGVAAAVLLLVASGGDAAFEHKGIARVEHAKEDVFEWLSDPELRVQWVDGLTTSKTDAAEVEKGVTLREVVGEGADRHERTLEVLEAEFGSVFSVRITEPGRTLQVQYRLSPNQSGKRTRVDYVLSGQFEAWWARVWEPFLSADLIEELEADLERLNQHLRKA